MATVPQFAATPRVSSVSISTANTGRDGVAGAYGTVFTAGSNGSRIDWIHIHAITPVTAGVIRNYVSGNNINALIYEIPVPATIPTISGADWSYDYVPPTTLILQSGFNFRTSTQNAEQFMVTAFGGDF